MVEYGKDIIKTWDNYIKDDGDCFTTVKRGKKSKSSAAPDDLFRVNKDSKN